MIDDAETADSLVAAVARIPSRNAPQAIGRYRILRALGAGGMGVVYEAEDPELSRKVAIKLLHGAPEGATTDRATRLKREAQTLAKLMHPNVVTVFDVGTHDGELYIVMQLVDGTTLDRHVAGKSVDAIVAAFVDAGRGLVAAHAEGIVHRDFKPANVLVGRDGTIRVSDFGLATSGAAPPADATVLTTAAGIGTPAYMAPEQFTAGAVTAASDQFAFCVALWEALYGERPFCGSTYTELSSAVTRGERREPPDRRVPRRVRAALVRGLAPEPRDRFASLSALLTELAPPRRRIAAVAALGGVIAIAAIAFVLLRGSDDPCEAAAARDWSPSLIAAASRGSVEDVRAVARFSEQWPELRREACRDALERRAVCLDAAISKLARGLARPSLRTESWGDTRSEVPMLERCREPDPDRTPIVTPIASRHTIGEPPTGYALAPDGRIAVARPRMIEILAPTGAHVASVASPHLEPTDLQRWTDGGLIFRHSASLEILDPDTGATLTNVGLPLGSIAVSNDGKRAFVVTKGKWALAPIRGARDVPTAPIVTPGRARVGVAEWSPNDQRIATIALTHHDEYIGSSLRIIDTQSRVAVDHPIMLEHGVVEAAGLVWLDDSRVVVNGRVDSASGEGLWIAHLDAGGSVIAWEHRLSAAPGIGYVPVAVRRGRMLAEQWTNNDKLVRIRDGVATVLSETLEVLPRLNVQLSTDQARVLVGTPRGRGWFTLESGAFVPIEMPNTNRVAIDRDDRILSISDRVLRATDAKGTRSLGPVAGHRVRCDPTGANCVVYGVSGDKTTVTVLGSSSSFELPVDASDVAVAPDGTLAAAGLESSVILVDPRTRKRDYRIVQNFNCPKAFRSTQDVAWAPDGSALFVTSRCGAGRVRIDRLAGDQSNTLYDGPLIGPIAVTREGDIVGARRRREAQPVLIEGL